MVRKGQNVNIVHEEKSGNLILYRRGGGYHLNDFENFSQPCKNLGLWSLKVKMLMP